MLHVSGFLCYHYSTMESQKNFFTVSKAQRHQIKKIAQKFGLKLVVLFGSKAEGRFKEGSDLDIAVLSGGKPTYKLFSRLFSALSKVFKKENIDLRFLNEANPLFRFEVIKNGILLAGEERFYKDFKIQTIKSYIDDGKKYFPYLERLLEKNQKLLKEAVYA